MDGAVDIVEDVEGLVAAPAEAGAEEGAEQDEAVVELDLGAGHVELVAEPVDVEKGRGELVEDEGRSVVVDEGTLVRCGLVGATGVAGYGRAGE